MKIIVKKKNINTFLNYFPSISFIYYCLDFGVGVWECTINIINKNKISLLFKNIAMYVRCKGDQQKSSS